jgi:hypothetical protein
MYNEICAHSLGSFPQYQYWSSSEVSSQYVYTYQFGNATANLQLKNWTGIGSAGTHACRKFSSVTTYNLRDVGPAGGFIFWKSGDDYLEASPADQVSGNVWSNITNLTVGTGTAIGTGQANTTAIIGQIGHTTSAAKLCDDLIIYN